MWFPRRQERAHRDRQLGRARGASDDELHEALVEVLTTDPDLVAADLEVTVRDGHVVLDAARHTLGVVGITDNLRIRGSAPPQLWHRCDAVTVTRDRHPRPYRRGHPGPGVDRSGSHPAPGQLPGPRPR